MIMLLLYTLLASLDYLTGLAGAYITGTIDSRITRDGLIRKSIILIVLWSLFGFIEWLVPTYIDPDFILPFESLTHLIPSGFVIYEIVSLIENLGLLGVKIPYSIEQSFVRLKDNHDSKNEEDL